MSAERDGVEGAREPEVETQAQQRRRHNEQLLFSEDVVEQVVEQIRQQQQQEQAQQQQQQQQQQGRRVAVTQPPEHWGYENGIYSPALFRIDRAMAARFEGDVVTPAAAARTEEDEGLETQVETGLARLRQRHQRSNEEIARLQQTVTRLEAERDQALLTGDAALRVRDQALQERDTMREERDQQGITYRARLAVLTTELNNERQLQQQGFEVDDNDE